MLNKIALRSGNRPLPRAARRIGALVRPRVPTANTLAPLASEPAVKSRLHAYFELCAARRERPDTISQEAVDAALAQVTDVLQTAEAEYHHALHQVARRR